MWMEAGTPCQSSVKMLVTQSCRTLCSPMDCSPWKEFSKQECLSGQPFPSPGDLPNPGIEPRSSALQADALPSKPPGKIEEMLILYWRRFFAPSRSRDYRREEKGIRRVHSLFQDIKMTHKLLDQNLLIFASSHPWSGALQKGLVPKRSSSL